MDQRLVMDGLDWIVKLGVLIQLKSVMGSLICGNQLPNERFNMWIAQATLIYFYSQIDDYCYESGRAACASSIHDGLLLGVLMD